MTYNMFGGTLNLAQLQVKTTEMIIKQSSIGSSLQILVIVP